jgi:hypothetical protein
VPVLPGKYNGLDQTYVETADGLRKEILENKSQNYPIQHEDVHFFLPEAAIPLSQAGMARFLAPRPADGTTLRSRTCLARNCASTRPTWLKPPPKGASSTTSAST